MDLKEFFITNNKSGHKTKSVWLEKNHNELYFDIIKYCGDKLVNLPFKVKVWHFINDINEIPLCECGKTLKFKKSLKEGYGKFCSISCTNKSSKHKLSVKTTNMLKYGGSSPSHSKLVRDKMKKTTLNKFGVDNIFKDVEYIKEKTIKSLGVEHISKLESVKIKRFNTNIEKYGVGTPLILEGNRNKGYNSRKKVFNIKYDKLNIINVDGDNISINCDKCGSNYTINRTLLFHRYKITDNPCLICHPKKSGVSIVEREISDFIESLGVKFETNNRGIIKPFELDLFIPSHNIAIEYNGLYWHSEKYVDKNYHLNKTELCNALGIQLIHIFEDEWLNKEDIVKSRLKNILGLTPNKIYARKCEIREVSTKVKTEFLNKNHIQGPVGSKVNLGLYFKDELVSLMTFGKRPILNNYEYELIRFCNKLNTTVIGGASRLFKNFVRGYSPKEIISYADRRWSTGNLYHQLGFTFSHNSTPNWFIINNNVREHRVKYQKHRLIEQGFDGTKTAHEICLENELYRIYDCGTITYKKTQL